MKPTLPTPWGRNVSVTDRLDGCQRRHQAAGYPLGVSYKYFDDNGGYLAALITYYACVSLFPLLLLMSTVLGFVLAGNPHLQDQILHSALARCPVVGSRLGDPKRIGGGPVGLVVGIVGALLGGLGVAQVAQYAMNTAWAVPRNSRSNPLKARGRSLLLLATVGPAVAGTMVLSTLGASSAGSLGPIVKVAVLLASVAIYAGAFVFATARDLSARRRPWCRRGRGHLAVAADLWRGQFGPRHQGCLRHQRRLRARPGPARLPLHQRHRRSALRGGQRRPRRSPVPQIAPHPRLPTRSTSPAETDAPTPARPKPSDPKASKTLTSGTTPQTSPDKPH